MIYEHVIYIKPYSHFRVYLFTIAGVDEYKVFDIYRSKYNLFSRWYLPLYIQ